MISTRMMRPGRHRQRVRTGGRSVRIVLLTLVVLGLVFSGTAYAGYAYEQARAHQILPGVRIHGIDVGGMTRLEAIDTIRDRIEARLERPLTVHAAGADLRVTAGELGTEADVVTAVDRALAVSSTFGWTRRVVSRLWNRPVNRDVTLGFDHDPARVETWLAEVAEQRNVAARDASVDWVDGGLALTKAKPGRLMRREAATAALLGALELGSSSVTVPFKALRPKVREDNLGHTIIVRTGVNVLTLFDGLEAVREYRVATGTPGYPTPHGHFTIVNKRVNPTWVNPAPTGWGRGLPASIGPGPGNPLGTRALDLDAPGIRIHGTYASYSIGSWASHGCIRMLIPQSEELFDLVDVGTRVIIVP
jgi:lipoprotein-anchoring transpeptidase ErfK/SrfK